MWRGKSGQNAHVNLGLPAVPCALANGVCAPVAARAMLMKADILLLDEPTNHLDVTNVAWLENYLNNIPDVSSMIVSHDSGAHPRAPMRVWCA